jgi:hypothetical protein
VQPADGAVEVVSDLRIGLGDIVGEADGEVTVGKVAERGAERTESMRLLFRRLGAFGGDFGLGFGFNTCSLGVTIGLRLLPRHRRIGFIAGLVDRQHLETLDCVRHCADLVLAVQPRQDDLEITAGEFEHRGLDCAQRAGHVTRHDQHHAAGQNAGSDKKSDLHHEIVPRCRRLCRGLLFGGVKRSSGDAECQGKLADRIWRPLLNGKSGGLAGNELFEHFQTLLGIGTADEVGFELADGRRQPRRRRQSRSYIVQRSPSGIKRRGIAGIGEERIGRRRDAGDSVGDDERHVAGGVAHRPGELLDLEQLIHIGILQRNIFDEPRTPHVERGHETVALLAVLFGEFRRARRFRLQNGGGGLFLKVGKPLDSTAEIGDRLVAIRIIHGRKRRQEAAQCRHFLVTCALDQRIHARELPLADKIARRAETIDAQAVERHEHIGRDIRNAGDPIGRLQPFAGLARAQRQHHHDHSPHERDDGFQQDAD